MQKHSFDQSLPEEGRRLLLNPCFYVILHMVKLQSNRPTAPWLALLVPSSSSGSGSLHWRRTRLQEMLLHIHLGHPSSPPFSVRVGCADHGVRATLGNTAIKARRAGVTLLHLSASLQTPNTSAGATWGLQLHQAPAAPAPSRASHPRPPCGWLPEPRQIPAPHPRPQHPNPAPASS